MALLAKRLTLTDFRSYSLLNLSLDAHLTVLVGPNAAGKTNALEAIQILVEGESFRRSSWADVIATGAARAALSLEAEGDGRVVTYEVVVDARTGRRTQHVNGKALSRAGENARALMCVVFTPDDLRLVKDSAERRRATLDTLGGKLSTAYLRLRKEYERTVRQRNAALKAGAADEQLAALDELLVSAGVRLRKARRRLFERIRPRAIETYEALAPGEAPATRYVTSAERDGLTCEHVSEEEAFRYALEMNGPAEKARQITLCGPHRDDVEFSLGGAPAREFASQGQQRTMALAWKMAEAAVITDLKGVRPLLLLDDVMSELDEARRDALTAFIKGASQAVVTTANLGYFSEELLREASVVRIG